MAGNPTTSISMNLGWPHVPQAKSSDKITCYQIFLMTGRVLIAPLTGLVHAIYNLFRIIFSIATYCCRNKTEPTRIVHYGKELGKGLLEMTVIGAIVLLILDLKKKPSSSNPQRKEEEQKGRSTSSNPSSETHGTSDSTAVGSRIAPSEGVSRGGRVGKNGNPVVYRTFCPPLLNL